MEPLGPILIVLSIPMALRWVPPNPLYGFRVPATCKNKSVWYDANALSGRHFILLGVVLVALDYLLAATTWSVVTRRDIHWAISITGLVIIVAADWRTANRWSRERQQPN